MAPELLTKIKCPQCTKNLEAIAWDGDGEATCTWCQTPFAIAATYPALAAPAQAPVPTAVKVEAGATCFYHDENEAVHTCDHCGRYLCNVCSLEFDEGVTCPACVSVKRNESDEAVGSRVLYDRLALGLAVLPLIIWPFTLLTAPTTIGVVIYGWKKPTSLVGGGKARMLIAAAVALIEIVGWTLVFVGGFPR
ncbi:hypothetical protein [Actomonas aquatica]|uniref:B box-type domain-containing protein n=1 Tax=Actomonas aquatica TaxID=2866162 RepID=A0ABZ1C541_9BACT|nr:hypothetical protein [Opitutus sp. WL0086]WRQ86596.1 hypothetical protein K1X11_017430 [Opitutus sp. WL0086]